MRRIVTIGAIAVVATPFFLAPIMLLTAGATWRTIAVYAVVAPMIGVLLASCHQRARFASYIFLTMESVRSVAAGNYAMLAACGALILYLQLPHMRRLYPSIATVMRERRS